MAYYFLFCLFRLFQCFHDEAKSKKNTPPQSCLILRNTIFPTVLLWFLCCIYLWRFAQGFDLPEFHNRGCKLKTHLLYYVLLLMVSYYNHGHHHSQQNNRLHQLLHVPTSRLNHSFTRLPKQTSQHAKEWKLRRMIAVGECSS